MRFLTYGRGTAVDIILMIGGVKMTGWVTDNIGNIVAVSVICLIVFFALWTIIKNKRSGKGSCSCGCGACPVADSCHKEEKR